MCEVSATATYLHRHKSEMRQPLRSILLNAFAAVCAAVLLGSSVQGQPPLEVNWTSELPGFPPILSAFVNPNNDAAAVVYGVGVTYCTNDEFCDQYDQNGIQTLTGVCLSAGNASLDQYVTGASSQFVLNACNLGNTSHCYIYCNGSYIYGLDTGPPSYGYASANCVLVDGSSVYIGGFSTNCSPTGSSVFKLGGGALWPSCVPASPMSLEATPDSILSVSFPTVHMVDKATGTVGSSFDLFSGTVSNIGKTCMSGDTLYWACKVNGSLHIGKYLLWQGSLWEQVLPFTGFPIELVRDGHGRLWTAVNNNLLWVDAANGNFASETIGIAINAMDLQGDNLVVAGAMGTNLNFIMHGTPMP